MTKLSTRIIAWQRRDGRNNLPWQNTRDAYRIWLSEIMLQQTQVSAVVPYYERFLDRFPDVLALARADVDEVMRLWAGLGYYARARNLHRAAQQVAETHGGVFPSDLDLLRALPGIGRSTAAAIAAFAFGTRAAILDGNVKRVFARHFGVEGDIKSKGVEDLLWRLAEAQLPAGQIERYTQGLMDLGATVCTRSRPRCLLCPLAKTCAALEQGRTESLPGRGTKRELPHRQTRMLVIVSEGSVMLEKRPPTGIWGGLWSLPETRLEDDVAAVLQTRFGIVAEASRELERIEHGFTHYSLSIFPLRISVERKPRLAMEPGFSWLAQSDAAAAALPAPVKRIVALSWGT
jgi:A/G-specific adenine glycosylase